MTEFFNKTKGPLSFELHDGSVVVVPPKGRVVIASKVAPSAALLALVRQGVLRITSDSSAEISAKAAPAAVESLVAPEAVAPVAAPSAVVVSEPAPLSAPTLELNIPAATVRDSKPKSKYENKPFRTLPSVAPISVKEEAVTVVAEASAESTPSTSSDSADTTVAAE